MSLGGEHNQPFSPASSRQCGPHRRIERRRSWCCCSVTSPLSRSKSLASCSRPKASPHLSCAAWHAELHGSSVDHSDQSSTSQMMINAIASPRMSGMARVAASSDRYVSARGCCAEPRTTIPVVTNRGRAKMSSTVRI